MTVSTIDQGPSLFDPKPSKDNERQSVVTERAELAEVLPQAAEAEAPSVPGDVGAAADTPPSDAEPADAHSAADDASPVSVPVTDDAESPRVDRKRLAEQLDALRRKEAELLRAIAVTDHPDLADAIRTIEARVYCVTRADAKLAQGLSKGEARRQETINKKLSSLREKRAELDAQIEALDVELQGLGAARLADFEQERQDALRELMVALATHDAALQTSGLDVQLLLPELSPLMPELETIARTLSEPRTSA